MKYKYSQSIADAVKAFLVENDWHFSFNEDIGIFDFNFKIKNTIQMIRYQISVHQNEVVFYGNFPVGIDCDNPKMMAEMAEFICRANYGLLNGCFELDCNDGEIRYKSFIDCEETVPSPTAINNSIGYIYTMFKRYTPGITNIIFADCSAKEAIGKCERFSLSRIRKMLTEMSEDSTENTDITDTLSNLFDTVEQLQKINGNDKETDEEDEKEDKEEV